MKFAEIPTKKIRFIAAFLCLLLLTSILPDFLIKADATTPSQNKERIIVSMGDSYSAGEGILNYYGQSQPIEDKVKDHDWLAHRSENSWPGRLTLDGKPMIRNKNWYFVAASGAETPDIKGEQKKEYATDKKASVQTEYLDPQIKVLQDLKNQGKEIDYVTITIGGNDAHFSNIIEIAAHPAKDSALQSELQKTWDEFYADGGIRDRIREVYELIHQTAPEAKIIVAGYPKLISEKIVYFNSDEVNLINSSVTRFNNEIEAIVNSCKADGMKICFVSVEKEFEGNEAYASSKDDEYLIRITKCQPQDINQTKKYSASSIHPNDNGAKAYAKCVQDKIDSIEKDGGKSEWPDMGGSEERDVVLVLDASGSMEGTPMEETKEASAKFVNTVLKEEASIGIVSYDESAMRIANFSKNANYLIKTTQNLNAGGGTNMEAGLKKAHEMLSAGNAKKKIIVLMSDGEPNRDKVGDELVAYADELKKEGIYIYTLGFFSDSSSYSEAQRLMERIASPGCHHEVDDAANLVFFFNDIADQIRGEKYIYVRIACPVDVTVKYNGEVLSSKDAQKGQRTSFGTLTFEENPERNESSTDNRIKTLRLKDGYKYDIKIKGNGKGTMNYTIGFMDDDGNYSDLREFSNIKITPRTTIDTVAVNANTTTLRVDEDGDGDNDYIYRARKNSKGEVLDCKVLMLFLFAPMIVLLIIIVVIIRKKRKTKVSVAVGPVSADKDI